MRNRGRETDARHDDDPPAAVCENRPFFTDGQPDNLRREPDWFL